MVVPFRTKVLLAEVGRFDNELSAYLWFDYLRSRLGVERSQVLLTVTERKKAPLYRIEVVLPNNALIAIPFLAQLEAKGFIEGFELVFTTVQQLQSRRDQSTLDTLHKVVRSRRVLAAHYSRLQNKVACSHS